MFAEDRSLKKIEAKPSDITTLLVSTNRPLVALSGPPQQADAFIVTVARGKSQPVFICFHVIKEGERLIYASDTVPTGQSARIKLEEEALQFVEDMGFMMVNEGFDGLSRKQRDAAIMELAPFVDDLSQIRHDEKQNKKEKKDSAATAAQQEVEYEEVYEEVEEEVPVEEEEEAAQPEEYESLSDVVTEVSKHEAAEASTDDSGDDGRQEPTASDEVTPEAEEPGAEEQAFDLGEELSDVVETIRDIPEKLRTSHETNDVRPEPVKPEAETLKPPETEPEKQDVESPKRPEPGPPKPTVETSNQSETESRRMAENVPEEISAVVRLLISL